MNLTNQILKKLVEYFKYDLTKMVPIGSQRFKYTLYTNYYYEYILYNFKIKKGIY